MASPRSKAAGTPSSTPSNREEASYRYLKNMIDNIADPIFVKDRQHRWIDGNKAFWALMGGLPEKFLGKSDYDFFSKEEADVFWDRDDRVFNTGKADINEEFLTDHQGRRHVLLTTKTVFLNEKNEPVLVGVIRDITAQKELEEMEEQRLKAAFYKQLEAKVRELQETNYELSRFAWVASHDLQEPLRTAVINLELLAQHCGGKLDEHAREYIHTAVENTHRLQRLVEDLLVHARVEKVTEFESVDLNQVLRTVIEDLQAAIQESQAEIMAAALPTVQGDVVLLSRIFQNLLSNAMKFRQKGECPRIRIDCKRKEEEWVISVKDNGIGIDPAYHQRIFGFFERLHPKSRYPGSGIGLATCKKIVNLHGGNIWVESAPSEGSTFFFTLPDRRQEANHAHSTGGR